jgi:hypothetical protein
MGLSWSRFLACQVLRVVVGYQHPDVALEPVDEELPPAAGRVVRDESDAEPGRRGDLEEEAMGGFHGFAVRGDEDAFAGVTMEDAAQGGGRRFR